MITESVLGLFISQDKAFAVHNENGNYIAYRKKITPELIERHLKGEVTLGVYNLDNDSMIKWICFDIDRSLDDARKLFNYLRNHDIYKESVILESTGGRGWHIWIFFVPKIPAQLGRRIGEKIIEKLGIRCEVFPKQNSLNPDSSLGNLVKLPLGIHRGTGKRSFFLSNSDLENIKPVSIPFHEFELPRQERSTWNFLPFAGCKAIIEINHGIPEGERDESAFQKSRLYFMIGAPPDEALEALKKWNEKNRPPLQEGTLKEKIKAVYSKRRYKINPWSLRGNDILGYHCEGCVNPVCERSGRKVVKGVKRRKWGLI